MNDRADIVIIGAGAVGTAIARELSKYQVRVVVVDKRDDVGGDASKSNSSIICSGFDCTPGTLNHSYVWHRAPCLTGLQRSWIYLLGSAEPSCRR